MAAAGLDGAVVVDSAGTRDWHVGDTMDPDARAALAVRGRDGSAHRARQFDPSWLAERDLVLAMDSRNLADLGGWRGSGRRHGPDPAVRRGRRADRYRDQGHPRPWGGGPDEFGHVLDLLGAAAPVISRPAGPAARDRRVSLSVARRIAGQTGLAVREARVVGSQHGYQHLIIALPGGQRAFAKVAAEQEAVPAEMGAAFAAEASGLAGWPRRRRPGAEVLAVTETALVISMIPPGHPTPSAAFGFARTRPFARRRAAAFGAPWRGFIASLPLDNTPGGPGGRTRTPAAGCCPTSGWRWKPARCDPKTAAGRGCGGADRSLAGPAEPPSRIHADCWPGTCTDPATGAGSSTRPPTAATARPSWPSWTCSARPTWTASWPVTPTRRRWRRVAGQDPAAPAASAPRARMPVRLLVPGRRGFRGPFGPVGPDPSRLPGVAGTRLCQTQNAFWPIWATGQELAVGDTWGRWQHRERK